MPVLWTQRLKLRPFTLSDSTVVEHLAGERDVATATHGIPYPYPSGLAAQWIATHKLMFDQDLALTMAVVDRASARVIGCVRLAVDDGSQSGKLGFWIGKPYWNNGYATEAAQALLQYALKTRKLAAVYGAHRVGNDAAGRVLEKLGLLREPALPNAARAWGRYDTRVYYGCTVQDLPRVDLMRKHASALTAVYA
jgi:RimJ/RimL family protein N-acetyltransferase